MDPMNGRSNSRIHVAWWPRLSQRAALLVLTWSGSTHGKPISRWPKNIGTSRGAIIRAVPASERSLCFFRLWTLKEAYLKAIGTGLGTPLKSFAFALNRSASRLNRARPTIRGMAIRDPAGN